MFKINKLRLQNFRLFRDTEIDFTQQKGGIYNLIGKSDTMFADSNSSGKSSLSIAIEQALTGSNRLRLIQKDLRWKYSDQLPTISIDMDIQDDNILYIQYLDKGKAELYQNGKEVFPNGKKSDIKDWIDNKIGLRPEIIQNLLYISSKSQLFFTETDTKQQYKLLVDLLGLDFIETYEKEVDKELKGLKGEYKQLVTVVETLQESVKDLTMQIELMPNQQVRDVTQSIKANEEELEKLEKEKKPLERKIHELENTQSQHRDKMSELSAEIKQLKTQQRKAEKLKEESLCPTCSQPLNQKDIVVQYNDNEKQLAKMNEQIDKMDEQNVAYRNELIILKKELDDLKSKIIKTEHKIKELKNIEAEQYKVKARNEKISELGAKRDQKTEELIEKQVELDNLEKNMAAHEIVKVCAGKKGFISDRVRLFLKLFNQHLAELAKELLDGEMTIKVQEVKSREFALLVNDGEIAGGLAFNELSEGLASRVKVVALLALLEVIEVLSGISFNILFIDELLSAIDETGIRDVEELLGKVRHRFPDKLIFVVSHNQKLNNTDGNLLVERVNNESSLRWV